MYFSYMKTKIITLLLILTSFAMCAGEGSDKLRVKETTTVNKKDRKPHKTETARVYKDKNYNIKKALEFRVPKTTKIC